MKIEPTGIVLTEVCSVQTARCVAKKPVPITAVWTLPGRIQINVCRPCLEEQVRSGEWEIQGAKIKRRADVAVYSPDKKLQLVVEVKKKPETTESLKKWATRLHRNLIAHSGIPNTPYFLLAILPGYIYLWKADYSFNADKAPDYEIEAQEILRPYFERLPAPIELATEYQLEFVVTSWLNDLVNSAATTSSSAEWLQDSGLFTAIANGSVVMQAPVAA
jgi:hypothetical protein